MVNEVKLQRNEDRERLESEDEQLFDFFGNFGDTMLVLYQVCLDGIHWGEVYGPLTEYCPLWATGLFMAYTTLVKLAFLNIVTGVFCTSAMERANEDQLEIIEGQLRDFFLAADTDKNGE